MGLVNSVFNLPDGQVMFFRNLNNRRTVKLILLIKKLLELVEMMSGLVNASFSLREWQAVKKIFFAPWLPFTFLTASWWKMHSHIVEFLSAVFARFNVTFYLEYHCTAVSEVSRGKKWSVNPFQTPKVQETLMFRNEHRWNLIFFLAWHVIESHLLKELSLIFLAKKLICIGEKFVPQTACLSSEVNK